MIPIAIEIVLDNYSKKIDKSVPTLIKERSFLILFLISPSIVYLVLRETKNLEVLYVTLVYCRFKAIMVMLYQMVKSQFHGSLRWMYFTALAVSVLATSLTAIAVIFNWSRTFQIVTMAVNSVAVIAIISAVLTCCYKTHKANIRKGIEQCSAGEFLLYAYSFPLVILPMAHALWFIYNPQLLWMQQDEKTTLFQTLLAFVFSIVLSIVPAQVVKLGAVVNMESLKLKQAFVRYVAHEIRSPLNVVHAGLDILRSEIKNAFPTAAGPTIVFLNDLTFNRVYSPSLFPIGTFSLDQTWQPLFRVLVGKLKWAAILAEKNRVSLTVSDSTLASEFGLLEKWGGTLDAAASDDVTRFHDSVDLEGGGGTQRPEDRRMAADRKKCSLIADSLHSVRWLKPPNLMVSIGPYMMIPSKEGTPTNSTPANSSAVMTSSTQRFLRPSVLNLRRNNAAAAAAAVHCSSDSSNHGNNHSNDLDIQSIVEQEDDSVKSPSNFVVKFRNDNTDNASNFGSEKLVGTTTQNLFSAQPNRTPLSHLHSASPVISLGGNGNRQGDDDVDDMMTVAAAADSSRRSKPSYRGNSFLQKGSSPYSEGSRLRSGSNDGSLFTRPGGNDDPRNRMGENDHGGGEASFLSPLRMNSPSAASSSSSPSRKPLRFLIVDDSLMNRKMMARILNADRDYAWLSNAYIADADDGVTCLEIVRRERDAGNEFDIVLMDYHMNFNSGTSEERNFFY
eukprot:gene24817-33299_t